MAKEEVKTKKTARKSSKSASSETKNTRGGAATAKKTRTAPKKRVVVNKAPSSLIETNEQAGANLNNVISQKKKAKKKKVKKESSTLEKRFWQIIIILFIVIVAFLAYYVFKDVFKDSRTPRYDVTEQMTVEDEQWIESLTSGTGPVENTTVDSQGPVIYVILYLSEDVPRKDVIAIVNDMFAKIEAEKPEILKTYDFNMIVEITVPIEYKEGEQARYPYMGSRNAFSGKVVWSSYGQFEEPIQSEKEED